VIALPPELKVRLGEGRLARVAAILQSEAAARASDLREAESLVGELVKAALGEVSPRRVAGWFGWAMAALSASIVAAVVAAPFLFRSDWEKYRWRSSSAVCGFGTTGTLGKHGVSDLVFHTADEDRPWVVVDMLKVRPVDRIILKNRQDCCAERGLPLVVEVGKDKASFAEVGRKKSLFDRWVVKFPLARPALSGFVRKR